MWREKGAQNRATSSLGSTPRSAGVALAAQGHAPQVGLSPLCLTLLAKGTGADIYETGTNESHGFPIYKTKLCNEVL